MYSKQKLHGTVRLSQNWFLNQIMGYVYFVENEMVAKMNVLAKTSILLDVS